MTLNLVKKFCIKNRYFENARAENFDERSHVAKFAPHCSTPEAK